MSTTTTTPETATSTPNTTATVRTAFQVAAPHPVTLTTRHETTAITEITTNSGLVIERGHALRNKKVRRNLKDLYANCQVGDIVTVANLRESMSLYAGMRYRGWTVSTKKQGNGTFEVQRLS